MANGYLGPTFEKWLGARPPTTNPYTEAAEREIARGNLEPITGWPGGRAYTLWERNAIGAEMQRLRPTSWVSGQYEGRAGRSAAEQIKAKLADKQSILATMIAPGDWVNKWLIEQDIKKLQAELSAAMYTSEMGGLASAEAYNVARWEALQNIPPSGEVTPQTLADALAIAEAKRGALGEARELQYRRGQLEAEGFPEAYTAETLPIPEWMQPYISKEGLIPLGAQAGLGTDELQQLMGYMGWEKGGKPTGFTEEYAQALGNLPTWWEEYTRGAQKLFPTSVKMPKPRWGRSR